MYTQLDKRRDMDSETAHQLEAHSDDIGELRSDVDGIEKQIQDGLGLPAMKAEYTEDDHDDQDSRYLKDGRVSPMFLNWLVLELQAARRAVGLEPSVVLDAEEVNPERN